LASDLTPLATELRLRLARGELAMLGPVELATGCRLASLELAARVTLADLDHVTSWAEKYQRRVSPQRWERLLEDLWTIKRVFERRRRRSAAWFL
jgi:hypothetical protein